MSRSFLCLGVSPPALALWDVDGDSFEDVLLRVAQYPNETHPSKENKSTCLAKNELTVHLRTCINSSNSPFIYLFVGMVTSVYSAVALSGVSGQVLWSKVTQESLMYIQCGLQLSSQQSPVVILISKSIIMAVNGTTGE